MGYAKLIDLGKPDFIEIKGMTYCGNTSGASNLTMKNVPYHDDVKAFGEALCAARIKHAGGVDGEGAELTGGTPAGAEYGLACEHRHSCCILLARKDPYLVDGSGTPGSTTRSFRIWRLPGSRFGAKTTCSRRRTGPCGARRRLGSIQGRRACVKCAITRAKIPRPPPPPTRECASSSSQPIHPFVHSFHLRRRLGREGPSPLFPRRAPLPETRVHDSLVFPPVSREMLQHDVRRLWERDGERLERRLHHEIHEGHLVRGIRLVPSLSERSQNASTESPSSRSTSPCV